MTAAAADRPLSQSRARARGAARLAAVQALYQMELTGIDAAAVADEFIRHRLRGEGQEDSLIEADVPLFRDLVLAAVRRQAEIDNLVDSVLVQDWTLGRLDSTLRALLRAGVAELLVRPDTPVRVIITEYVEIAHAFFGGDEPGMANAVLDKLAHRLRPDAFGTRAHA